MAAVRRRRGDAACAVCLGHDRQKRQRPTPTRRRPAGPERSAEHRVGQHAAVHDDGVDGHPAAQERAAPQVRHAARHISHSQGAYTGVLWLASEPTNPRNQKPLVLYSNLPRLVEAVVKSLDPNSTADRDAVLDSATEILGHVVDRFVLDLDPN